MYLINKETNSIQPLIKRTFTALGIKERAHLQEWIANNPSALGEELLIIQKEFSGFLDTYERLDLLALDKAGNLVVIENKLDDSGKDVTWQALKYAAYCSSLTKDQIEEIFQNYLVSQGNSKSATLLLSEFFDHTDYSEINLNKGGTQRIIFIAANFRKEVTATVLWLMRFNIQLKCFKATPFELNDQLFLTLDQIIPIKDAQDYMISMASKAQEEVRTEEEAKTRHKVRLAFWGKLLNAIKGQSLLFQNSSATKDHWLTAGGLNISGISYQLVITMNYACVLLYLGRSSTEENKKLFDVLSQYRNEIEKTFGTPLNWERADDQKSSRISFALQHVNYFNEEDWSQIINFLIKNINLLEASIKPYLPELKKQLKHSDGDVEFEIAKTEALS